MPDRDPTPRTDVAPEPAAREPGERRRSRGVAMVDIDPVRGEIAGIELAGTPGSAAIDLGEAEAWELVLALDGRPCGRLVLPDPGATPGDGLLEAAAVAACRDERARALLARSLRRRIGASTAKPPGRPVSVVVCTRGRPRSLAALLLALGALDPAPLEIVVVDNAPAEGEDCRELVEAAGAVYVREDDPGLNRARRAGIAAARGELLAFTDDDCLPPRRWLASLPELFDDHNVGAATGPGFPVALDTPAQGRFERAASFTRGFQRREWDFRSLSPAHAVQAGAGANMVLRSDALARLGDVFPAELDAGTPTRSGGDMYALFKVLAAGMRVIYEPRLYTYHRHRADPRDLHRAIRGYGVGLGAVAAKLLIDEREPEALLVCRWLVRQYLATAAKGLVGASDPVEVRLAWDYLRGGIAGPAAWRRSLRRSPGAGRERPPRPARADANRAAEPPPEGADGPPPAGLDAPPADPEVTVVVITHRPGDVPGRCLAALADQAGAPPFEVILVDDSSDRLEDATPCPPGLRLRRLRTGGQGAAAARNAGAAAARGDLLIFLDDDLVPAPELVAAHARRQRGERGELVVVGYSPPRPVRPTLIALSASLWWEDHFRAKRDSLAPTFTEVLSGNVSIDRRAFERVGSFDVDFGRLRREDWEWGIRALRAGVGLAYEPGAVADHRFSLDTRGRLEAARAEGAGDALLVERHPAALSSLPTGWAEPPPGAFSRLAIRLLLDHRVRERVVPVIDALERLRLRGAWRRWFDLAHVAAYQAGFRDRDRGDGGSEERGDSIVVELCSDEPVPAPRIAAPLLELTIGGGRATRLGAVDGQWTASLAERAARRIPRSHLGRSAACIAVASENGDPGRVTVILGPAFGKRERGGEARLRTAGAEVRFAGATGDCDDAVQHWRAVDEAIRDRVREIVVVPLPGAALPVERLGDVATVLQGSRVAALTGGGEAGPVGPILHSRTTLEQPYPVLGSPSQYVALRTDAYLALGGIDPGVASYGHQAVVLDLLDRALDAGWAIGSAGRPWTEDSPNGRRPSPRAEWERWHARGRLMRRRARTRGAGWWLRSGAAPVVVQIVRAARRADGLRGAVGRAAAFLCGSIASSISGEPAGADGMD